MKTKSINLFEFDELPENIKAKVLENERDINVDGKWYEFVYEMWEEKLEAMGFDSPDISFSGFWSQGDGASFTSKHVDIEKFLASQKAKTRFKALLRVLETDTFRLEVEVERIDTHYSHEYTVRGNVEAYDYSDKGKHEKAEAEAQELEALLTETVRKLSKQIYRDLESEHEGLTSDEAVIDTIKANEYTFRSNGEMENE